MSGALMSGVVASAEAVVVVALLMLLVARELAAVGGPGARPLARNLTVIVAPLLVLFGIVVAHRLLVLVEAESSRPPATASAAAQAEPAPTAATPGGIAAQPGPVAPEAPVARVSPTGPRLVLEESFAQPPPGWPNNQQGVAWISGYYLSPRQPSRFVAVGVPVLDLLRNVVVSAKFRKLGGPPGGGFGVILRDQSPSRLDGAYQGGSYYVLEVGDIGEVGIWRRAEDHWQDLVPWTRVASVRTGTQPNELVASAQGERLRLTVNGVEVASATDPTPAAGRVGIFAGGDFNEVVLERLVVQAGPD